MRGPLGPSGCATTALLPLSRDDQNASGLDRVPVVVVDVGAVEAFDHLGGAGAGFDRLENAKGDEGATVCIVQAARINDEGGPPARGSLPGGLAATLVRTPALFRR